MTLLPPACHRTVESAFRHRPAAGEDEAQIEEEVAAEEADGEDVRSDDNGDEALDPNGRPSDGAGGMRELARVESTIPFTPKGGLSPLLPATQSGGMGGLFKAMGEAFKGLQASNAAGDQPAAAVAGKGSEGGGWPQLLSRPSSTAPPPPDQKGIRHRESGSGAASVGADPPALFSDNADPPAMSQPPAPMQPPKIKGPPLPELLRHISLLRNRSSGSAPGSSETPPLPPLYLPHEMRAYNRALASAASVPTSTSSSTLAIQADPAATPGPITSTPAASSKPSARPSFADSGSLPVVSPCVAVTALMEAAALMAGDEAEARFWSQLPLTLRCGHQDAETVSVLPLSGCVWNQPGAELSSPASA